MKQETQRAASSAPYKFKKQNTRFNEIPGQSKLFLDLQYNTDKVKKFYPNIAETAQQFADDVLEGYKLDRVQVADALREINLRFNATRETLQNIDRLEANDTVAVLTGQQTGLFGGPLYTIYKALSAIRYAELLNKNGINAVPIFWMATEDHDHQEIASTEIFVDKTIKSLTIDIAEVDQGRQVGEIKLDDSIESLIGKILSSTASLENKNDIAEILRLTWTTGNSVGDAFGKMLMSLLGKYGLIVVDATDAKLRRLAAPIFKSAIEKADEIVDTVIERGNELTADGYHEQVLVEENYFPLFWVSPEGRRETLKKIGDDKYAAISSKHRFTKAELLEIADKESEKFSPGVMLRPVVQDWLFPTIKYIGGAAEAAYFAQNAVVYQKLDRPVTPVMHRQSFTIIDGGARRAIDNYALELVDIFLSKDELTERVLKETADVKNSQLVKSVAAGIKQLIEKLKDENIIDEQTLDMRQRKIEYHLSAVKRAYLTRQRERDQVLNDRINALYTRLLPHGVLQERKINIFSFIAKYGINFIDLLYQATDPEEKDHIQLFL